VTAFEELDALTVSIVGDTITYAPEGGDPVEIKAFADHSDQVVGLGVAGGVTGDASIEVLVSDVAQPSRGDVITLPRTGQTYRPSSWTRSRSGTLWMIYLKRNV
jgi:hypothetical protein